MKLTVGCGTLNQTPLDWDGNISRIIECIEAAKAQQVQVLCLPELCITGYGCEDVFLSNYLFRYAEEQLAKILPCTDGIVVALGLPIMISDIRYNCAALLSDGKIHGLVPKQNLDREGVHYEPRWFNPGKPLERREISILGETIPFGDLLFDFGAIIIGFEICEDAWVKDRPGYKLHKRGANLILNPMASHFAFDKYQVRKKLAIEGSKDFHATYMYTNLLGNESGRIIFDGDSVIASKGEVVSEAERLSFKTTTLNIAQVEIPTKNPVLEIAELEVKCDFEFHEPATSIPAKTPQAWETSENLKEEEFSRAVALGLFDYMRKSKAEGFVISLSGGADSSAVACLVWIMVELACKELGLEEFKERLSYATQLNAHTEAKDFVNKLLTCVYQSTKNSSQETKKSAANLSEELGAKYLELDVDQIVGTYTDLVAEALDRSLSWENDDLTLQNIQARVRGPSVWMISNLKNALLLAASNRSEAAVGYATMDGDTCGGLSPIAGIDKAFLLEWLKWLEKDGLLDLKPLPVLKHVNSLEPTAELRPLDCKQRDEEDLMPYAVLDRIERLAIGEKLPPQAVLNDLKENEESYSAEELTNWVRHFFTLWSRNQWKRERYAPSFHVDDGSLDPKTWCRFPILSGSYESELRKLSS